MTPIIPHFGYGQNKQNLQAAPPNQVRAASRSHWVHTRSDIAQEFAAKNDLVYFHPHFPLVDLRGIYLAHLIHMTPILQTITEQLARRYHPGDEIRSTDFLHRIYEVYGQRGVVTNCTRHFLRTLSWFSCLERLGPNRYRFVAHLPIGEESFPLLVYSWLKSGLGNIQIDISEFSSAPLFMEHLHLSGERRNRSAV
ncbi:MAG: hypothetical protein EXR62_15765 [Chloroflexi bacterium]|nr:hypothetical protein [Chloroflexota bacterium]